MRELSKEETDQVSGGRFGDFSCCSYGPLSLELFNVNLVDIGTYGLENYDQSYNTFTP